MSSSIQFSCHKACLKERIKADVEKSQHSTLVKYMNFALELILSRAADGTSSLEEMAYTVSLFDSLPISQINVLACTQNRNFGQMLRHLVQIGLTHYPPEAIADELPRSRQSPSSDMTLPQIMQPAVREPSFRNAS